ncbi:glycosyltransferase family 2 protein [Lachnoclostridium sp. Marseille-P6806]|uniref:glycosyltransferase family 2 protein n=1 Tax=Lachnoclostridium sp. Marseille-P6806 TaxID=2364793 RepID=UPI00102F604D|nr:glycosyltransferase family 2 protein [Lachnoclostridium sp. Marseille-P6806]
MQNTEEILQNTGQAGEEELSRDYRAEYERERVKSAYLADRVAQLEDQVDDLSFKLNRIKTNPVWRASRPARECYHWVRRQSDRLKNQGSLRGVAEKIRYKRREKQAQKSYGTASFPDEAERARQAAEAAALPRQICFSILVPLYNTPEKLLRDMIDSVENQTYGNWELCLADGSDAEHAYVGTIVKEYRQKDARRIKYTRLEKNGGISANTNACLVLATGDFYAPFDHDDYLHPSVLYWYVKTINEQDADYLYCDEATFKENDLDHFVTMHFKPDYAIDTLRANNYICHLSAFDRRLLEGEELYRPQYDGSQDHDMILRLTDKARHIVHVPKLLYYWRQHAGSTAGNIRAKSYAIDAARGAVADHLRRHGYRNFRITSTRAFETIFKITYEIEGNPMVSIVIANRDHEADLRRCLTSIFDKSTYENFEIVIVENGSTQEAVRSYYRELAGGPYSDRIHIVDAGEQESFNYASLNNMGVAASHGEYVLLLNNDTQVISVNWIEELLMYAQRRDVACVGGKLYYPDKTIQHAGIILGLGAHRTAGHPFYGQRRENLGYMGRLCYAQDLSAVTGACLMVRRALWDQVSGLSEEFAISLNDVDLCLKMRQAGYLNVFTPFCELYHYESASRGSDVDGKDAQKAARYEAEAARFRGKWRAVLEQGDPYYNPNFTLDRSDLSLRVQT